MNKSGMLTQSHVGLCLGVVQLYHVSHGSSVVRGCLFACFVLRTFILISIVTVSAYTPISTQQALPPSSSLAFAVIWFLDESHSDWVRQNFSVILVCIFLMANSVSKQEIVLHVFWSLAWWMIRLYIRSLFSYPFYYVKI